MAIARWYLPFTAHTYRYNAAGQREVVYTEDGAVWNYQYDSLGQVTAGRKTFADGSVVPGVRLEYAFDDIGNRKQAKLGGGAQGLRTEVYTVDSAKMNQYSSRTVSSSFDVLGLATPPSSLTINSSTPDCRKGGNAFNSFNFKYVPPSGVW